jgi:hypothetical protein
LLVERQQWQRRFQRVVQRDHRVVFWEHGKLVVGREQCELELGNRLVEQRNRREQQLRRHHRLGHVQRGDVRVGWRSGAS